ncbi:MAG: SRPBCC family protein [Solirubrobacteraceae bacterium]
MYGTLEQRDDGRWQLRFTRNLAHPIERVWRAVTEPEHLAKWFPSTIEGERATGATLRFSFPVEGVEPIDGEMLAYEPPTLMRLSWGADILELNLRSTSEGTELTLIDILDEHGKAARDGAGWHKCLDALESALQGEPDARERLGDWSEVHAVYVERFGPEAATIGPPEGVN